MSPVPAAPAPDAGPAVRAYGGLFIRFALGPTTHYVTVEAPSLGVVALSGLGAALSGDIGAALIPDLMLHLRGMIDFAYNPNFDDGDRVSRTQGVSMITTAIGPAVTYYLLPAHVFATGGGGILDLALLDAGADVLRYAESDTGFWLGADAGIEGWLSSNWSGGIALRVLWGRMPGGDGSDVEFLSFGAVASLSGTHLEPDD